MDSATPQQQRAYVNKVKQEVEVQQMQELVSLYCHIVTCEVSEFLRLAFTTAGLDGENNRDMHF